MSGANPDLGPDPLNRLVDGATRSRPMSRYELHKVFREVVRWELANGRLSTWRRHRLVRYAASLRISAVDAGALIQEVVRAKPPRAGPADAAPAKLRLAADDRSVWPIWTKLAAVAAGVMLARLVLGALFTV